MKLIEIVKKEGLTVFCGEDSLQREVTGGYTSDLLSDVMGHAASGKLWITLQTHKNVMAIAALKELAAILLVKGFKPEQNTLEQGRIEGIPILGTTDEAFEISGRIFKLLNEK